VHVTQIAMAAAVTLSITGVCYTALNPDDLEQAAREAAAQATCRTVDSAIVAYIGLHGEPPASIAELTGYVKGDITAYRIVDGQAAGPGC
jgi:hypothetical protein